MAIISEEKKADLIRFGHYFLGLINDLKRRPEDAARELDISLEEINAIIGQQQIECIVNTLNLINHKNHLSFINAGNPHVQ